MKLSEQIYKLRTAKGMSQEALAEALEVSRQSVSKWETGASVPELDKLVKMRELFGVTLDELVTGEAPASSQSGPTKPDWNHLLGMMLYTLAGLCLILTVFFTNLLGLHMHHSLSLAALFVLLGCAVMFPDNRRVFGLCLRWFGGLCVLLLLQSPFLSGLFGFSAAMALVLYLWRLYILRNDDPEAP